MPAPTNVSAITAIDLGTLPAAVVQDVNFGGTTYTVWYKYTAVAGDNVIGVFGTGDITNYFADLDVFESDGVTPYLDIQGFNVPIQMPVTPGDTYYFRFTSDGGNVTPAILTLGAQAFTNVTAPLGSIFINDENIGFPLALLSATLGTPLQFLQGIASGERGAILNSGIVCLADQDGVGTFGDFKIYTAQMAALATISGFTLHAANPPVSSNKVDRFYLGDPGAGGNQPTIKTADVAGAFGPTTWGPFPANGLKGICPSNDETILYYVRNQLAAGPIRAWDLSGNLALPDFAAGLAGYALVVDLLVLEDDSVVAGYRKTSAPRDFKIIRYDAAGSVLNTYTFPDGDGSTSPDDRLAYATDSPASFWAWMHKTSGADHYSIFKHVRVSDGVELASITAAEFEVGAATITPTISPADRFGHAFSCPFLILRAEIAITPPTPPAEALHGCPAIPEVGEGSSGNGCLIPAE